MNIASTLAALAIGGTTQSTPKPHLHQPERGEHETFADYKARRAASNKANRNASRDPNHGIVGARKQLRDSMRKSGAMGLRTRASDALMASWASKRVTKVEHRDDHGAYTLVGRARTVLTLIGDEYVEEHRPRRVWLAGISAQRGY